MQRAAISVPLNIAEGAARGSNKDFIRFLRYSTGSISELETQLIICKELELVNDIETLFNSIFMIRKKLCGLIRFLKNK